jgi:hypothetical protein
VTVEVLCRSKAGGRDPIYMLVGSSRAAYVSETLVLSPCLIPEAHKSRLGVDKFDLQLMLWNLKRIGLLRTLSPSHLPALLPLSIGCTLALGACLSYGLDMDSLLHAREAHSPAIHDITGTTTSPCAEKAHRVVTETIGEAGSQGPTGGRRPRRN